jgi:hypothetical protein
MDTPEATSYGFSPKIWKWLQDNNLTTIQYRDLGGYGKCK